MIFQTLGFKNFSSLCDIISNVGRLQGCCDTFVGSLSTKTFQNCTPHTFEDKRLRTSVFVFVLFWGQLYESQGQSRLRVVFYIDSLVKRETPDWPWVRRAQGGHL